MFYVKAIQARRTPALSLDKPRHRAGHSSLSGPDRSRAL